MYSDRLAQYTTSTAVHKLLLYACAAVHNLNRFEQGELFPGQLIVWNKSLYILKFVFFCIILYLAVMMIKMSYLPFLWEQCKDIHRYQLYGKGSYHNSKPVKVGKPSHRGGWGLRFYLVFPNLEVGKWFL